MMNIENIWPDRDPISIKVKKMILKIIHAHGNVLWRFFGRNRKAARVLIIYDKKVLLVKKSYEKEKWMMPGGFVKSGEIEETAAKREVLEEVGVHLKRLDGSFKDSVKKQGYPLLYTFVAEVESERYTVDGVEIDEARWYPFNILSQINPVAAKMLKKYIDMKETDS